MNNYYIIHKYDKTFHNPVYVNLKTEKVLWFLFLLYALFV